MNPDEQVDRAMSIGSGIPGNRTIAASADTLAREGIAPTKIQRKDSRDTGEMDGRSYATALMHYDLPQRRDSLSEIEGL